MDSDYWHAKWGRNEIGFHEREPNSLLKSHWPAVAETSGHVFVPLCGKSLDMLWLLERGYRVTGAEISPQAVRQFFEESSLEYEVSKTEEFEVFRGAEIDIWCGDFFRLRPELLAPVEFVYDRAASVALPGSMRQTYSEKLVTFMTPAAGMLLVTLEYDQGEMSGPPFSVNGDEVWQLYGSTCDIDLLATNPDALADNAKFASKGLTSLSECVYKLSRRSD